MKGRRETSYSYNELELLVGEVETSFEPVVQEASPEFVGVIQTMSLPHGEVPLSLGTWSVYKIYKKVVIWMLRSTVKEVSA